VGAGLLTVSASSCNWVAGCDVTPTTSLMSPQQGQSVASVAVIGVLGIVRRIISMESLGRRLVWHGNIFRISSFIGSCKQQEKGKEG
jgi:hypothetical protein